MKVLVIDPVSSGVAYANLLEQAGLEPVLLDTVRSLVARARLAPTPGALDYATDFGSDVTALAKYCESNEVGYLIVGAEAGVPLADALRPLVPWFAKNDPEKPERRWDKAAMSEALAAAGVPGPQTRSLTSLGEVQEFAETLRSDPDWTFVVKPSIGSATVNVRKVETEAQLLAAASAILDDPGLFGDFPKVLIQEFDPGREFVIDTLSHNGQHHIVAVCVYDKRPSSLGSFVYERLRWISETDPLIPMLESYSSSVLDALGVRTGVGHMEVILTEKGPRFIDYGARSHGSGHPLKTFRLTGTSQIHAEVSIALAVSRKMSPRIPDYHLRKYGAIAFFNIPEQLRSRPDFDKTTIGAVEGVVEFDVSLKPGYIYPETQTLLDGLDLGLAYLESESMDQLSENCAKAQATFLTYFERTAEQ